MVSTVDVLCEAAFDNGQYSGVFVEVICIQLYTGVFI